MQCESRVSGQAHMPMALPVPAILGGDECKLLDGLAHIDKVQLRSQRAAMVDDRFAVFSIPAVDYSHHCKCEYCAAWWRLRAAVTSKRTLDTSAAPEEYSFVHVCRRDSRELVALEIRVV